MLETISHKLRKTTEGEWLNVKISELTDKELRDEINELKEAVKIFGLVRDEIEAKLKELEAEEEARRKK